MSMSSTPLAKKPSTLKPIYSLLQKMYIAGDVDGCCGLLRKWYTEVPNATETLLPQEHKFITDVAKLAANTAAPVKRGSIYFCSTMAGQLGEWEIALLVSRRGIREGVTPSGEFLGRLATKRNWPFLMDWCKAMDAPFCVSTALAVLGQAHECWSTALSLAQRAEKEQGVAMDAYSAGVVVPYLAHGGHWDLAISAFLDTIAQGHNFANNLPVHMLKASCSTQEGWRASLTLYSLMNQAMMLSGCDEEEVREACKEVCGVAPSWEMSMAVLQSAVNANNVTPDESFLASVVSKCDHANQWEAATSVYAFGLQRGYLSAQSTGAAYTSLVRSYRAASYSWDRALLAYSWMTHAGNTSNATGLTELIDMCMDKSQWAAALKVGTELLETKSAVSSTTYNSLISACAIGGQWSAAIRLFDEQMKNVELTPQPMSICSVLEACQEAKQWAVALRFFSAVSQAQPAVVVPQTAFSLAVKVCTGSQRWFEAMVLLEELHRNGLPYDTHGRRTGLWAAALSGSWQVSLEHLRHIPVRNRKKTDQILVRQSTHLAGPMVQSKVMKLLMAQKK